MKVCGHNSTYVHSLQRGTNVKAILPMVLGISKKRYNTQIIILFLGICKLLKDNKDFIVYTHHTCTIQHDKTSQESRATDA